MNEINFDHVYLNYSKTLVVEIYVQNENPDPIIKRKNNAKTKL